MASEKASAGLSADNLHVVRTLGYGATGTVFLAQVANRSWLSEEEEDDDDDDHAEDNKFALKLTMPEELRSQRALQCQLNMEVEVLSSLCENPSPFLPTLLGSFADPHGGSLIALDFAAGGDLHKLQSRHSHGGFSEAVARFYCAEVLLALEHLHKLGYVYRDLKPENVVVRASGHVMLVDFDLCGKIEKIDIDANRNSFFSWEMVMGWIKRWLPSLLPRRSKAGDDDGEIKKSRKATCNSLVGTVEYVAPEMLNVNYCAGSTAGYGYEVDWWALGIFLYELLCGKTPFSGRDRKQIFYNIVCKTATMDTEKWSPAVCDLLHRLLQKSPRDRLGFGNGGADEIKRHEFFHGLCWEQLHHLSRPPFIPGSPFMQMPEAL